MTYHIPVLAKEVLSYLAPKANDIILDCTLGGGGHASLILDSFSTITYYGIDQDTDALNYVKTKIRDDRLKICHGNFAKIKDVFEEEMHFDGILMDLGVSSFQLDEPMRGFSYMKEGPLDMRMDQTSQKTTAEKIINEYSSEQLADIFYKYGEERKSRIIASAIVKERESRTISDTQDLVSLIHKVIYGSYQQKQSSVKRVFQSLRIEVNQELALLEQALVDLWSTLNSGGRMLVITFHSLEDRIVKNTFKTFLNNGDGLKLTKGAVAPKWEEIKINSRAKSARLRGILKK